MKPTLMFLALVVAGSLVFGCSNRSSTQEATATCQSLAKVDPTIAGDSFNACVACFENCSDCEKKGTSPPTFQCPGDNAGGAGGSSSTSATSSTSTGK